MAKKWGERGGGRGFRVVHIISIVNKAIRTNSGQFQIFLREIFATQKT